MSYLHDWLPLIISCIEMRKDRDKMMTRSVFMSVLVVAGVVASLSTPSAPTPDSLFTSSSTFILNIYFCLKELLACGKTDIYVCWQRTGFVGRYT